MPPIRIFKDAPLHPPSKDSEPQPEQQKPDLPPPTRTTDAASYGRPEPTGPPLPQPGARPKPTSSYQAASSSPPAPQPGATPTANKPPIVTATHTTTETIQTGPPPQFGMAPPSANVAPTRSTTTAAAPQAMPRTDPPLPMTSPAETGAGPERHSLEHPPGYAQNPYAAAGSARGDVAVADDGADDGLVGQAKRWAESAGEGLKNLEESAWKWVKGPK